MSDNKIFVGSGKDHKFQNGGQALSIALDLDAILEAYKEYGFDYNGKRYLKIKAVTKREPDQHGKTHYVEVDTYKPNQQQGQGGHNKNGSLQNHGGYTPPSNPVNDGYEDDIPF